MIVFKDKLNFTPSYTPVEMFQLGIFGGAYFQIKTNLPEKFLEETKDLPINNTKPDKKFNYYNIISGASLEWWQERNLIHTDDPNGWVEWYVKFYYGRRHKDDDRQIKRFRSFVSRHSGMLKNYHAAGKDSVKTKQNLLQWAWNFTDNLI